MTIDFATLMGLGLIAISGMLGVFAWALTRVLRDVVSLLGWISKDLTEGLD